MATRWRSPPEDPPDARSGVRDNLPVEKRIDPYLTLFQVVDQVVVLP
jgi:hypothetical protein